VIVYNIGCFASPVAFKVADMKVIERCLGLKWSSAGTSVLVCVRRWGCASPGALARLEACRVSEYSMSHKVLNRTL
jgi:hypothetical protein